MAPIHMTHRSTRALIASLALCSFGCGGSLGLASDEDLDTSSDTVEDTLGDTELDPTVDPTVDMPDDSLPDPADITPDPVDVVVDPADVGPDPSDVVDDEVGPPNACTPVSTLVCGDTLSGSNDGPGSTMLLDVNGCGDWNESGPEIAWLITLTGDLRVTFDLTGLSADLDMFLFGEASGGCDTDLCLDSSGSGETRDEQIVQTGSAGDTWYLLVDGWSDAVSDFVLEVTCVTPENCDDGIDNDGDSDTDCDDSECRWVLPCYEDVCDDGADNDDDGDVDCDDFDCMASTDCELSCTAVATLDCGTNIDGDTRTPGTPDEIDRYSCSTWLEDGPEAVYSFTATATGEVTARLSGLSVDLDVFILEDTGSGCLNSECIDVDNNTATFGAVSGVTYYIVVDGYRGVSGDYHLELTCG